VQLIGIDAYHQGQFLGSVVLDDQGGGVLDLTPTPEPSSLVFLATGLAGVAEVITRRAKA